MPAKTAPKKGWKDIQSKNRIKKRTRLALIVLGIVLGIIIIGWIVKFTQTLFSPWKFAPAEKSYIWNGEFNINVLIKSKDMALLSYNPTDKTMTVIRIPDEVQLEVWGGFGKWQARAIYGLGQLQKMGDGNKLLKRSVGDFFGLPIEGFLQFEGQLADKSSQDLTDTLRSKFLGLDLLSNLKTDLTLWELIRLKFGLASVRFDKVKYLDLASLGVLDKDFLADGTAIYTFDPVKIDAVSSKLSDPKIISEHKTIAVFNSTDYPLIAQKAARMIANLGGNVIITGNSEKKLKETEVFGEESKTLKRLLQIFNHQRDSKLEPFSSRVLRAQINVMLGEDFFNR
ncbi:LytR C-terminal domain-containing protein [Candidatus Daviesbacteria bacterium]|nr:LytR C-terminal domain-containing protein [Candidatus Daviesbacteria bacterium]